MTKLLSISFLLISLTVSLSAQKVHFGTQTGFGFYKMESLRDLGQTISENNLLEVKQIDNYPPYYYFQPYLSFTNNNLNFGFQFSYHSTGSRYSLKDYSGEYYFDTQINSICPATFIDIKIFELWKFQIFQYNELGIVFSKLALKEYLMIGDDNILDDDFHFRALNYYLEPGLKVSYPFSFFIFEINLGYFQQFGTNDLYFKDHEDISLQYDVTSDPVKVNWSGIRLGFGIGICL